MRKYPLLIAALFAATLGTAAAAPTDRDNRVAPPDISALLAKVLAAAKSGQDADIESLLADESRRALNAPSAENKALTTAQRAFRQALDARFGRGTPMNDTFQARPAKTEGLRAVLKSFESMELVSVTPGADGSATVLVKVTRQTRTGTSESVEGSLAVKREGDAWKLVLPDAADQKSDDTRMSIAQQITEKVRAGAYPSRQAAMIAMSNALAAGGGR
jgi:hypothetical protein